MPRDKSKDGIDREINVLVSDVYTYTCVPLDGVKALYTEWPRKNDSV